MGQKRQPITIGIEAVIEQAQDETLKKLAHYIALELKDVSNSPLIPLETFCEQYGVSRNTVMSHKDEYGVYQPVKGGKAFINMAKLRDIKQDGY